jgi:glycine/D-amino acid oxidase-like deaminating enzyme
MTVQSGNSGYPETWYVATGNHGAPRSPLAGECRNRVGVIGGGLAGLSVALELLRMDTPVTLIEAQRVAWGASGRNGGFVTPGFALDIENIAERTGAETADSLYALSRQGAQRVRENIATLAPDCLMGEGKYSVSRYPAATEMRAHARLLRDRHGEEAEYLDTGALRRVIRSARYFDGIYKPGGFHIHPHNYALALANEIVAMGGHVHENSRARRIERMAGNWVVHTGEGSLRCDELVICTSGYDAGFFRPVSRSVLPVATHVAVTAPLARDLRAKIPAGVAIADTGMACDYYRLVDDGRILWGGKITTRKTAPQQLDGVMRRAMVEVFPGLAGIPLDYRWSGLMGYCRHRMPVVRRVEQGLWVSTAYGGHGLNTTAMGGMLLAAAIAGGDQRWRDLDPFGLAWGGGPAGRIAVQARYWSMQATDRWRELRAEGGPEGGQSSNY